MFVAVILGVLFGACACAPFVLAMSKSKNVTATSNIGYSSILMLSVFVSFAVLFASILCCYFISKDSLLPMGIAEAATIVVFVIALALFNIKTKH